jgi:hypothetical protein
MLLPPLDWCVPFSLPWAAEASMLAIIACCLCVRLPQLESHRLNWHADDAYSVAVHGKQKAWNARQPTLMSLYFLVVRVWPDTLLALFERVSVG